MGIIPSRYRLSNLISNTKMAINHPNIVINETKRLPLYLSQKYHQLTSEPDGVRVFEEDWDNLIILDGCRYDLFDEAGARQDSLQKVKSLGSHSAEFLKNNVGDDNYHDTVYVSANPHVDEYSGQFHDTIKLYARAWDDDIDTVHPDEVVEAAVEAHNKYPDKRLFIHFMQPHFPFLGEKGREFDPQLSDEIDSMEYPIWSALFYRFSDVSVDDAWKGYRENLKFVMQRVDDLLDELKGKSVITSDHGNLVGEKVWPAPVKGYGHEFQGVRHPKLVEVPWVEIEDGERREVVEQPPETSTEENQEMLEDRLEALGYR